MIFKDFSDVRIIDGARKMYRQNYFPKSNSYAKGNFEVNYNFCFDLNWDESEEIFSLSHIAF